MIKNIRVRNFRSIHNVDVTLTPLTILIGANGTGKSNLVKVIEFIGEIPRSGLAMAINKKGGVEWMLPKAIPKSGIKSASTEIAYSTSFYSPDPNSELSEVTVDHDIKIKFTGGKHPTVECEKLVFHNVLSVSKLLKEENALSELAANHFAHPNNDSTFTLIQSGGSQVDIQVYPPADKDNIEDYIKWIGLPHSLKGQSIKFIPWLKKLWANRELRISGSKLQKRRKSHSFLDEDTTTVLDFCGQYHVYRGVLSSICRYDLLLNELRKEQNLSDNNELLADGTNMPSILKKIKSDEMPEAWQRLKDTFSAIAPHIIQISSSNLQTNKEFIKFAESEIGRPVESWETSDGSLRALAILLALESTKDGTTVIIEEPEQNLHPWAVKILMNHIKQTIQNKNLQVIITTHSQQVLEAADPEEVLIASRNYADGTTFKRVSDLYPKLDPEELGDLWVKGMLGGVPSYD